MLHKIIIRILISLLIIPLLYGCCDFDSQKQDMESDKIITINEKLDFNKEIIISNIGMADYAVKAPRDSMELYDMSEIVATGKVTYE